MFAGDTHTLLAVTGTAIRTAVSTKEDIFKLNHSGIGEKECRISCRNKTGRTHDRVSLALKEFQKLTADLISADFIAHNQMLLTYTSNHTGDNYTHHSLNMRKIR